MDDIVDERDRGVKGPSRKHVIFFSFTNFLKVDTMHFKTAHLRNSSPLGERSNPNPLPPAGEGES
jgi:hypothetical protein